MARIVYFTGTLPRKNKTPFGGGEVGNVRTICMLERFGYQVIPVRRVVSSSSRNRIKSYMTYPLRAAINLVQWFVVLMCGSRANSVVHISGFYGPSILVEIIQVFLAKIMGYKLVYELRGGGAISFYENGSRTYRRQFKYVLNKADYIFTQGHENEPLIRELCNKPIYFYPNYVEKGFYPEKLQLKSSDVINLLYFGRIELAKNPILIVAVTSILQQRFNNITLTIIGNGEKEIIERVSTEMQRKLLPGSYSILSGCQHEELPKQLTDKHFYIFPSEQPREGQSNAITEAMSFGIIPIASPQGFNKSTIGDDNLIVNELTAEAYAARITTIIDNGQVDYYSQYVRNRFINNYTDSVVFERTKVEYERIYNG